MSSKLPDISVLGLGIRCPEQVTYETEERIRACREVLYVDTGVASGAYLQTLNDRVTPMFGDSYGEEVSRLGTYRTIATRVVHAAMERGPVAFAVQGHPTVFVNPPFIMRDMADLLGLSMEVLPGVSSMAALLAELQIDPGVHGILMYEATDMMMRVRPLLADVPTLIWQPGAAESRLYTRRRNRPERLRRLQAYLMRFYPASHPVTALFVSPHPLVKSVRLDLTVGALVEHASDLHVGVTLYLPPHRIRPVWDVEMQHRLDDADYLRSVTED